MKIRPVRFVILACAALAGAGSSTHAAIIGINTPGTSIGSVAFNDTNSIAPPAGITAAIVSTTPWNGATVTLPTTTDPNTADFATGSITGSFTPSSNIYSLNLTGVTLSQPGATTTGFADLMFRFNIEYQLDAAGLPLQPTLFPSFAVNGTVQSGVGTFAQVKGAIGYYDVSNTLLETVNYSGFWNTPGPFSGGVSGLPVNGTTPAFAPNSTLTLAGFIEFKVDPATINAETVAAPEPASFVLAGLGLIGLLAVARRRSRGLAVAGLCFLMASTAGQARASLILSSGLGTTHAGNLVTNGSFETGAPADGIPNQVYWVTGTANTPLSVPPGWTSSGNTTTYALWGNETQSPYSIQGSDAFPDGRAGLYFGNGAPVIVDQPPTFNANGTVSFPAAPNFTNNIYPAPVFLSQTINTPAAPAPSFKFSFWVSGEGAVYGQQFTERGIFGLQVTNVLAGDPIQFLTVPNGVGNGFGISHLYEYTFTPLNSLQPVKINFINWGHFDLTAYSMSNFTTELVLDDVIVNPTPEPSAMILGGMGLIGLLACARQMRRRPIASPS